MSHLDTLHWLLITNTSMSTTALCISLRVDREDMDTRMLALLLSLLLLLIFMGTGETRTMSNERVDAAIRSLFGPSSKSSKVNQCSTVCGSISNVQRAQKCLKNCKG